MCGRLNVRSDDGQHSDCGDVSRFVPFGIGQIFIKIAELSSLLNDDFSSADLLSV